MQDRIALFMCNLKPAKMRGILSEGMIMCASTPEKVEIIDPPAGSKPGDRVIFEGYSGTPDEMLKPKQKVWEQIQPELHINGESAATYKGTPFQVEGIKGFCKAQTMTNCGIK
ncbi:unnamed protein product [Owenia fusiformis]|uniref:tRNA-binding domain-containing protein n=1 Tax=Owenia fusiformis TaxID=6347 RepID=A0A8S4NBG8_OWEFU|nr:unnamed protein product [Owenia fusiformis]